MPILADLDHLWGEDLGVTATGDIAVVSGSDRSIQRIIRRLLTVATTVAHSSYPAEPDYGVGLGARVGEFIDVRAIQAVVLSQMMLERSVARVPAPTVSVTEPAPGLVQIDVHYFDQSGNPQTFGFNLTNLSGN